MPRVHTDAIEQAKQIDDLRSRVAGELGVDNVTLHVAQAHRRNTRSLLDITERDIDLSDETLKPIGVLLARVDDFKIVRGATAVLSLATNAREFGPLLLEAAQTSYTDLLVCALFTVPRDLGLDDLDEPSPPDPAPSPPDPAPHPPAPAPTPRPRKARPRKARARAKTQPPVFRVGE